MNDISLIFQTILQNANDQVVPSMSTANATVPVSNSRKRRRSTEKLLNEIAQRGISVQHVANDARQLNANDIGRLQHLFRSNRNRIGNLPFRESSQPTSSTFSSSANVPENRSSAMSAVLRLFSPSIRIRNSLSNANSRNNRNTSSNIPHVERTTPHAPGSNLSANWQFLVGNTTLSELYRCAMASRNQQPTSNASRQNEQIRLIRRIRRARPSANNTNSHSSR